MIYVVVCHVFYVVSAYLWKRGVRMWHISSSAPNRGKHMSYLMGVTCCFFSFDRVSGFRHRVRGPNCRRYYSHVGTH